MPLKREARSDLIGTDGTKSTLNASGTLSGTLDLLAETNVHHLVRVWVVIVFHASATDDVEVAIRPRKASPDEADTLGGMVFSIAADAGNEVRQSVDVPVETWEELDCVLTNNDSVNAHTAWVSWTGAYF